MDNSNYLEEENIEVDFPEEEIIVQNGHSTYAEFKKSITKPAQLLSYENGNYILDKEILDLIRSIDEELIIVIMTGKCKSGKSFLMNLLINSTNQHKDGVI